MRGSNSPCMPRIHRRSAGSLPDFVLPCAHVLVLPCVGGRRHRGWSSWGSVDRWWCVEEGDTKQRGGRTAEAEVARERESQSGGGVLSRLKGRGKGRRNKGGKITVLPFPYLYRFRDRPYLNAARLIRNRFLNPSP